MRYSLRKLSQDGNADEIVKFGRNSETKTEAINAGLRHLYEEGEVELDQIAFQDRDGKAEYLKLMYGFKVFTHHNLIRTSKDPLAFNVR